MVMDLNRPYNTYLASTKHLGTIGGHHSPILNLNSDMTEIDQNGQTKQVNTDYVRDVVAIKDARMSTQMHVNGPK